MYGALTDEIRNILVRDYKVINRKVVQRRDYDEFLRMYAITFGYYMFLLLLFCNIVFFFILRAFESGELYDVIFNIHNVLFKVHKCILAARCEYFGKLFQGKWNKRNVIYLNHPLVITIYHIY